ncbi:MAG: hypothetical protein AAFN93_02030 [Bacteroidota bacterium]
MTRLVKAFWFLTVLISLAVLLYVYAGLPEVVAFDLLGNGRSLDRETSFYIALVILSLTNFSLYALSRHMKYRSEAINTIMINWQLSLAGLLNFFYIVSMLFVFLLNSGESFNFNNFGYLIFVSLGFVIIWIFVLPILLIRNRPTI